MTSPIDAQWTPSYIDTVAVLLSLETHLEVETQALGERLGALLREGDVVLLSGDLGSGKTRLAQGIARGLGVRAPVASPTFVLMNEYEGRLRLFHADLYRLEGAEVDDLEPLEQAERGVLVVEWPERAADGLPGDGLLVTLEHAGDERRRITIEPRGERGRDILRELGPV